MPNPANKPIIAVDVDEVLALNAQGFVEFSNQRWGTDLKPEDYHEHWSEIWQVTEEEAEKRAIEYHSSGALAKLDIVSDAKKVLEKLSRNFKLVILTSRRAIVEKDTRDWIENNFPRVFDDIYLAGIWDKVVKGRMDMTKAGLLKELQAAYFIDDQLRHCFAAAEAGIETLLFGDYPWNQTDEFPEGVTRVKNWQEVLEYFDAEAR
jgi:uncharacterized HAD superfamily protein